MCDEYTIYALRGNADDPRNSEMLYSSLKDGEGRFGWSYIEGADLYRLREKIREEGWDSLSGDEKKCWQPFLLDLKPCDYVIYINVPEWGKCTLARVIGPYYFRYEDRDFNHRFPVDPESVRVFDRNSVIVHPSLSQSLKLMGRWWRIYDKERFEDLLKKLEDGEEDRTHTEKTRFALLEEEIKPCLESFLECIAGKIHGTHPNRHFEELLFRCFKNVRGVKDVQRKGGPGDRGADLVVVFKSEMPIRQQTCVVQAKAYVGEHWDTQAVEDIERAFKYYREQGNEPDMGLIVSTASTSTRALDEAREKLEEKTGKIVDLLIGKDLAEFVLRFYRPFP